MRILRLLACAIVLPAMVAGCATEAEKPAAKAAQPATKYAAIPKNKDNDLKLFQGDGRVVKGAEALGHREIALILRRYLFHTARRFCRLLGKGCPGLDRRTKSSGPRDRFQPDWIRLPRTTSLRSWV